MAIERRWVAGPAGVLMAALFLISAYGKVTGAPATEAYMEAHGVPGLLVWPAALWELTAGACLVLGVLPRLVPFGLAGWCVLTAVIFHTAWDPVQQMHFFKNMTMAGAFLLLASGGPLLAWRARPLAARASG